MRLECGKCEQDLRGGHSDTCSSIRPYAAAAERAMREGPTWGDEEARVRALRSAMREARDSGVREAQAVAREEGASDIARCIEDLFTAEEE